MRVGFGLPQGRADSALGTRLATLTLLRVVFLSVLLVILARWHLKEIQFRAFSVQVALIALACAFALTAGYATILRSGRHFRTLAYAQVVFDQITWTVLVYVSGGATSGATSLYGLTALTGAILDGLPAATVAAATGFGLYVCLCGLMIANVLPVPPDQLDVRYATTLDAALSPAALNLLVVIVVTLLAGYLAERLRLTGGKLEEATERAARAERLAYLGQVAAGLAHEIRNPLGSISASIELIRDAPGLTNDDRHLCDIVRRESSRLNDLVTDMLDLARPKKPDIAVTDLGAIAREVVVLAERSGRGIEDVKVTYEGPGEGPSIQADPAQLRQMLWNLVRNAVQATAPGTVVVIRIAPQSTREVALAVEDSGPGIPSDAIPHLFDAFFTTRTRGSGIGLAIVKRVADDHGWTVSVDSKEGVGTTFRIVVPRAVTSRRGV